MMGASIAPGLMTLVRILRSLKFSGPSTGEGAERCFRGAEVLYDAKPFSQTRQPLRMMEPPSFTQRLPDGEVQTTVIGIKGFVEMLRCDVRR